MGTRHEGAGPASPIQFCYGPVQRFGHLGRCQRWINVLGAVDRPEAAEAAFYRVNGGPERPLALGGDRHRLAETGDFNAEVGWDEVSPGDNGLEVRVARRGGGEDRAAVRLVVADGGPWPLPYAVDFSALENLQDAVQVVDGLWRLEADGVRTAAPYYDRVLCLGDRSWTDYETVARLTVHAFAPSEPGPPTYDVTHMGIAMRWRGHHRDDYSPHRKWYPLGAQGEFLLKEGAAGCQWRILFDRPADKPPAYAGGRNALELGRPALFKTQVATVPDGRSRYRFKQWMEGAPEPRSWDVEGFEEDDYESGALCLVPHNSDVTIHSVRVEELATQG